MRISWIPPSKNIKSASFRLRVAEIMRGLRLIGHTCEFYSESCRCDILIISKKYDSDVIGIIKKFRINNPRGRIIFDLCDNHFYSDLKGDKEKCTHAMRVQVLQSVLLMVDAVTTSSDFLADVVSEHCSISRNNIFAIDDCYEMEQSSCHTRGLRNIFSELHYKWFEWRLNHTNHQVDRFVWFGTHGVSYAEGGMFDLLEKKFCISNALKNSQRSITIISNSYNKYRQISSSLGVRTFYLPWNKNTIDRALALHSVLLLPIKKTPFTLSKSANRPVTAMMNRLIVISDLIPSYQKLRDLLFSPVDESSLSHVISMTKVEREKLIDTAFKHVSNEFSLKSVSEKWESILVTVYEKNT